MVIIICFNSVLYSGKISKKVTTPFLIPNVFEFNLWLVFFWTACFPWSSLHPIFCRAVFLNRASLGYLHQKCLGRFVKMHLLRALLRKNLREGFRNLHFNIFPNWFFCALMFKIHCPEECWNRPDRHRASVTVFLAAFPSLSSPPSLFMLLFLCPVYW